MKSQTKKPVGTGFLITTNSINFKANGGGYSKE
jgi:hypothetical protein